MGYRASNWYWIDARASIYSSATNAIVPSTDATYRAWLARDGNSPTPMPGDNFVSGSTANLDGVLTAAGLPATGLSALTQAQLCSYAWAKVHSLLTASRNYTVTGIAGAISCDCSASYASLKEVSDWAIAEAAVSPAPTQEWTDNAFNVFTLTPATATAFTQAVRIYGASVYAMLATVVPQIKSEAITTTVQMDALAWPV